MLHMMAWCWLPWWCCCSPSVIYVFMFIFLCLYALFDINLLWWHDDDGTMIVFLFAPGQLCLYLYALFDISIIWWHDADGYHDGLAVPPQGILEKHCQGRVSVRNPHLRFSHQDFVLALKNVSKDINLRKKIITIAYISSPFDPLIVWLAQISHFPGWN